MIFIIAVLIGCLLGPSICDNFPNTPCPNVAIYDRLNGRPVIYIRAATSRSENSISVLLYVAGAVFEDSEIRIQEFAHPSDSNKYYYATFPLDIRVPTINKIIFNGEIICAGPPPRGQITSTLCAKLISENYNEDVDEEVNQRCGIKHPDKAIHGLIANGKDFKPGDYPWMVALLDSDTKEFFCAGTLITKNAVLTATHCLISKTIDDIILKLGAYNLTKWNEKGAELRHAAEFKLHNKFNTNRFKNDIALIIMTNEVEFKPNILPACLWSGDSDQARILDRTAELAGWGTNERGSLNKDNPRMLNVKLASQEECSKNPKLASSVWDFTICAGNKDGSGPCRGDSGGGLYIRGGDNRFYVRGIVSISLFNNGLCDYTNYAVLTDVAKYNEWIGEHINPNRFETC